MSIQEVSPEQLAELFHRYHRALADGFAGRGDSTHRAWESISADEKARFVAAARFACEELSTADHHKPNSRRYFAKPGEAEWGC